MIAVQDIVCVRYQAPDLDAMERFLLDFGLHRAARTATALYMRGNGTAHHVHVTHLGPAQSLGFALLAGSADDLQQLARETGRPVETSDEPGGGLRVRLRDPSGLQIDVVHGMATVPALPTRAPLAHNPVIGRHRFNERVRVPPGPSHVMRAGHVALLVPDFAACYDFYTQQLGMRLSDGYHAGPDETMMAAFLHCGLGAKHVDHHTVALVSPPGLPAGRIDHSAFEVIDLDDVMRGHEHLQAKGHRHSWGLGRHLEGSQLFDYWRDPFGHKIEHWTDGDLVNDDYAPQVSAMDPARLSQWSPPLTPEFFV
jgi:catechol 2,3-dioxygenase-like lactoylglutathione lyase family enzyme